MNHFHALVFFINANPTSDQDILQITFVFEEDLKNPDFFFGLAPKKTFENIKCGELIYVSGLVTSNNIIFDDFVIVCKKEDMNYV